MPRLPQGTVTFLFTDLEGSPRLWERSPEAYVVAWRQGRAGELDALVARLLA